MTKKEKAIDLALMNKKEKAATKRYELRACPFCLESVRFEYEKKLWVIICDFCRQFTIATKSAAKAAKAWNEMK